MSSVPEMGFEPDHRVRVITAGGLSALTIVMPGEYLTGPDAETRLGDINWLAPRALRHEELIRAAMLGGPILPLRFGTAFSSIHMLTDLMEQYAPLVQNFLERVSGRAEFGVRIAYDRQAMLEAFTHQLAQQSPPAAGPGARYLQQKRLREDAARNLGSHVTSLCDTLLDELLPISRGTITRRVVADRGDGLETAASHALLIDDADEQAFRDLVARISERYAPNGIMLELTGPWPAYSFCPSIGGGS
jgi:hypothetical protein